MTAPAADRPTAPRFSTRPRLAGDDWITDWDPEDPQRWSPRLAWTTLAVSTYCLNLAFVAWFLVSAIAPRLNAIGFDLDKGRLYWLTAMPGLAGGLLRILWMFLPPLLGTRKLVTLSTALLAIPLLGWGWAVRDPGTPYSMLLLLSFACGIGGGVFSGFMPSTSYFFPRAKQGTALGIQAGVGNFGVSVVQFLVPWVVGFSLFGTSALAPEVSRDLKTGETGTMWLHNAGIVFLPWVALGVVLAWTVLRSVPVQANLRQQLDIFSEKHTWLMTALYIMTFGVFSGFAAQFGLLIKNLYGGFPDAPDPLAFAFLGPLVGSAARVAWGPLCDRFGGARWTVVSGVGMAASTAFTALWLTPSGRGEFTWFLTGMLLLFFFAGVGNASTFKQMPMIFERRQAGGVIGWTGAIAAFGPFIVGVALSVISPTTFFVACTVYFVACVAIAWHYYARPGAERPS
ncbi:nitrate/nitrite transporter [Kineosporia sp. A_224]|uniref:MFS transporter n=1 Tax=Kineosporia sp. A_224 TaxID=1962180 RepID=UPI0018EA28D0|nr:nitrate/nitrite transporter [Kineosporia sp. A_224]